MQLSRSSVIILLVIDLITITITFTINANSRVLGGEETNSKSSYYVASVRFNNVHICGGSIISSQSIITAAHCVFEEDKILQAANISVRLGSTNQLSAGTVLPVKSIVVHPEYSGFKNNLAILLLETPLTWTDRIKSIMLSTEKVTKDNEVRVSGWGVQPNNGFGYKLHTNYLFVISDEMCYNSYPDYDNSTFCVEHNLNEGNCLGDGGNGAIMDNFLVGIANFVIGACGSRYPDVYTDISSHIDWIKTSMRV